MPANDNFYYGFGKEISEGTPVKPSTSDLDVTIYKGKRRPLWSMIARLFRRKPKPLVIFKDSRTSYASIETMIDGKKYRGLLYPVKDEEV